jgi:uncharacterized protein DUF1353
MPFWRLEDEHEPDVMLKQVGPNAFQLLVGFRYKVPDEAPVYSAPAHDVNRPPTDPNNSTNLASVPRWLWWFVASYGLHTKAALLHDQLVDEPDLDRDKADHVFRRALEESKVRWMRRWLMWTAVSLATMLLKRPARFAAFVALLVAFVVLLAAWLLGWLPWWPALAVFLLGFVFRKRWPLAVVGLLLIAGPTVLVFVSLFVVWLLDLAKARYNKLRGRPFERPPLLPDLEPQRRF